MTNKHDCVYCTEEHLEQHGGRYKRTEGGRIAPPEILPAVASPGGNPACVDHLKQARLEHERASRIEQDLVELGDRVTNVEGHLGLPSPEASVG